MHRAIAFQARDCGYPLRQAVGTILRCRAELPGSAAYSKAFENDSQPRVARPAVPDEVFRHGVLLVAVEVANFHVLRGLVSRQLQARAARLQDELNTTAKEIGQGSVDVPGFEFDISGQCGTSWAYMIP